MLASYSSMYSSIVTPPGNQSQLVLTCKFKMVTADERLTMLLSLSSNVCLLNGSTEN